MKFGSPEELESHHNRHHRRTSDELLKQEISKLSSAIESEEVELLRGQIKALEESKALITNECQSLRLQLNKCQDEMRGMDNELCQLRSSCDDSEMLKRELVRVQKLMNDMSVEREKEKEELGREIKKQIEQAVNEKQAVQQELNSLKLKYEANVTELNEMKSKKEKLEVFILLFIIPLIYKIYPSINHVYNNSKFYFFIS